MVCPAEKITASAIVSLPLEITLLGTGTSQGIPVIGCHCPVCQSGDPKDRRLRTSAFIRCGDTAIVIDIGPDFRQQMLAQEIDDVHAVLITHEHNDHVSGLDDIRPINFLHQRDMPVYAHPRTIQELHRRFFYAFDPAYQYPGKPRVHSVPIDPQYDFQIGDIHVKPVLVDHGGMDVLGFRIGTLAYVTDAKVIPDASMDQLKNLDVLVLNALRKRKHDSHLTLVEAIELCEALQPKQCYLTHISHDMGLHQDVSRDLPPNIHLGYDGLTIKVA